MPKFGLGNKAVLKENRHGVLQMALVDNDMRWEKLAYKSLCAISV